MSNSEKEGMAGLEREGEADGQGGGTGGLEKEVLGSLEAAVRGGVEAEGASGVEPVPSTSLGTNGLTGGAKGEGEEWTDFGGEWMTDLDSEGTYEVESDTMTFMESDDIDMSSLEEETMAELRKERLGIWKCGWKVGGKKGDTKVGVEPGAGKSAERKGKMIKTGANEKEAPVSAPPPPSPAPTEEAPVNNGQNVYLADAANNEMRAAKEKERRATRRILIWHVAPLMMTLVYVSWCSFINQAQATVCATIYLLTHCIIVSSLSGIWLIPISLKRHSPIFLQIWWGLVVGNFSGVLAVQLPSVLPFPPDFTRFTIQIMAVYGAMTCAWIIALALFQPMEGQGQQKKMFRNGLFIPIGTLLLYQIGTVFLWHFSCDSGVDIKSSLYGSLLGMAAALGMGYQRLWCAYFFINSPERMNRMALQLDAAMNWDFLTEIRNPSQTGGDEGEAGQSGGRTGGGGAAEARRAGGDGAEQV